MGTFHKIQKGFLLCVAGIIKISKLVFARTLFVALDK